MVTIDKPELDTRQYRIVTLDNALECLLVHDPDTDKASAALDVNVGHLSDPWDTPGLAHFCEHLLFMGTQKYPRENDYSEYLSAHAGHSNAFTSTVDTNYFFEVGHEHLEGALDRFSQFFISPLFLESCKERELLAVDSESKKNLQDDMWRAFQLDKSLSNPDHVYAKFGTGNYETLKDGANKDVRDILLQFHKNFYSSNVMKLVVLGRHSLDELQNMTTDFFSAIPDKQLPKPRYDGDVLRQGHELGCVYRFRPVKDVRSLEVTFPLPECDIMWKSQPSHYLSHLLGHEGQGSALSYLKKQGWVLSLGAGGSNAAPGTDLFKCSLELTRSGLEHWQDVVRVLFTYISLMRQAGPQRFVWDEIRRCAEADFRFQDQRPASRFTSSTAGRMQKPYDRRFLLGTSVPREYSAEDIQHCLDCLDVDNFRIAIADPDAKTDKIEHWYGTEYKIERLDDAFLAGLRTPEPLADLHLPERNPFIPERFDTGRTDDISVVDRPFLIRHDAFCRLWHKKDDTFWLPKANVLVQMRVPASSTSPKTAVMAKLFIELLKDALNEYAYPADIAGLQYDLERTATGFNLVFGGYSDKMPVLVEKVLRRMRDLEVDQTRFDIEKERLERGFRNFEFDAPYGQVSYHMSLALAHAAWSKTEQAAALPDVTCDELKSFAKSLFQAVHVELLVHGNVSEQDAQTMAELFEEVFSGTSTLPEIDTLPESGLWVPRGSRAYARPLKDPRNVNSALEYFCHVGSDSQGELRALSALLAQIAQEPAFDQLRTKEQLGYVVFSGVRVSLTAAGFRFILQSERDPAFLEYRVQAFLTQLRKHIADMPQENFDKHKRALRDKINERLKNLKSETRLYWGCIAAGRYNFDERAERTAQVEAIDKAQLLAFFDDKIAVGGPNTRKLAVWLRARSASIDMAPAQAHIQVVQLLRDSSLLPLPAGDAATEKMDVGLADLCNRCLTSGDVTLLAEGVRRLLLSSSGLYVDARGTRDMLLSASTDNNGATRSVAEMVSSQVPPTPPPSGQPNDSKPPATLQAALEQEEKRSPELEAALSAESEEQKQLRGKIDKCAEAIRAWVSSFRHAQKQQALQDSLITEVSDEGAAQSSSSALTAFKKTLTKMDRPSPPDWSIYYPRTSTHASKL
ncbi:metalloprotease [Savitreella phatthalungensis]